MEMITQIGTDTMQTAILVRESICACEFYKGDDLTDVVLEALSPLLMNRLRS